MQYAWSFPSKAAQESGINKSTVTYWKNHTESKPTGQLAEKLCSYFNVSMSELYGDTQKETPPLLQRMSVILPVI